jgi:hypothetical protein
MHLSAPLLAKRLLLSFLLLRPLASSGQVLDGLDDRDDDGSVCLLQLGTTHLEVGADAAVAGEKTEAADNTSSLAATASSTSELVVGATGGFASETTGATKGSIASNSSTSLSVAAAGVPKHPSVPREELAEMVFGQAVAAAAAAQQHEHQRQKESLSPPRAMNANADIKGAETSMEPEEPVVSDLEIRRSPSVWTHSGIAFLHKVCLRWFAIFGFMLAILFSTFGQGLIIRKPSKNIWHDFTSFKPCMGKRPLRIRACTWNCAGFSDEDLRIAQADPQIIEEWLVRRAQDDKAADVIVICLQGVNLERLYALRQLVDQHLGEEYKLVKGPGECNEEPVGLATLVFSSRNGQSRDHALGALHAALSSGAEAEASGNGLTLGFVNLHLPSRKSSRSRGCKRYFSHYLSELLGDIAHVDHMDVVLALGDHSCSESKASELQGALVELDADVRLFGFTEAYSVNDVSGRDRVIYKKFGSSSSGPNVQPHEYKLCSFSQEEATATLSRGGRRPVFQMLTIGEEVQNY